MEAKGGKLSVQLPPTNKGSPSAAFTVAIQQVLNNKLESGWQSNVESSRFAQSAASRLRMDALVTYNLQHNNKRKGARYG